MGSVPLPATLPAPRDDPPFLPALCTSLLLPTYLMKSRGTLLRERRDYPSAATNTATKRQRLHTARQEDRRLLATPWCAVDTLPVGDVDKAPPRASLCSPARTAVYRCDCPSAQAAPVRALPRESPPWPRHRVNRPRHFPERVFFESRVTFLWCVSFPTFSCLFGGKQMRGTRGIQERLCCIQRQQYWSCRLRRPICFLFLS